MQDLRSRMQQIASTDVEARQTLIADILDAHALPDLIEDSIDLPELDEALVDAMTDAYEADLEVIAGMEGVDLILPFD